nr:unnamed protein product [Haemonchus contortus]
MSTAPSRQPFKSNFKVPEQKLLRSCSISEFGVCIVNLLTCRAEGDLEEAEVEAGVVEEGAGPDQRLQRDAADEVLAEEEGDRGELRVQEEEGEVKPSFTVRSQFLKIPASMGEEPSILLTH